MMVGYDISTKNYRLIDWDSRCQVRSRDVQFVENEMGGNQDIISVENSISEKQHPIDNVIPLKQEISDEEIFEDAVGDDTTPAVVTKSGRTVRKPAWINDYVGAAEIEQLQPKPNSYKEAISSSDSKMWAQSMQEEFKNLDKNDTWEIVEKPKDRNVLNCRWVYKKKIGLDGNVCRYRSRLVAKGYNQVYGHDYMETYAPVADYATFRIMLSIAANMKLKLMHLDFECAYLNGRLSDSEEIYMTFPLGLDQDFEIQGKVLKLKICLYGLKQSGRVWNAELNKVLLNCGLEQSSVDRSLYMKKNDDKLTLLLLYVDDIAIASSDDKFVNNLKEKLAKNFTVKDLGKMEKFLSVRVVQDEEYVSIDQEQLISETLKKYGMVDSNSISTPGEVVNNTADDDGVPLEPIYPLRALIGSLNYIANVTRPDISFVVNRLARILENPRYKDWFAAKRVLRYLKATMNFKIKYNQCENINLALYSDADYAGGDDKKSTSGFVALVNNAPITWYSRKQSVVALSTLESEYIGLATATQDSIFLKQLFDFIGIQVGLKIQVDNRSCVKFAENERGLRKNARHIAVKFYYVKDLVENKLLKLEYIESGKNSADICTKSLQRVQHQTALSLIGFREFIKVQGEC